MHRQVVLHHITTLLSLRHHCFAPLVAAQTLGKGLVTQLLFCVGQDEVMLPGQPVVILRFSLK